MSALDMPCIFRVRKNPPIALTPTMPNAVGMPGEKQTVKSKYEQNSAENQMRSENKSKLIKTYRIYIRSFAQSHQHVL